MRTGCGVYQSVLGVVLCVTSAVTSGGAATAAVAAVSWVVAGAASRSATVVTPPLGCSVLGFKDSGVRF